MTPRRVRGILVLVGALLVLLGLAVVARVPPTPESFYPKCVSYRLTGTHCPGCGTARALHAALNGHLAQALAYNPLACVLLPGTLAGWLIARRRPARPRVPGRLAVAGPWLVATAVVLFWVARNVPVHPLTLLAPHELAR